ncbi:MAG: alanine--tRNA ligase [Acidobacteria bacterium]|nr:alanine--tRNA ligase [Acidobacteriota bacterium]
MTANEIRRSFLKFFASHGHRIVPSSPLVPGDDPTLLFTNAGMNQFKDAFLGKERREYTRATTAQKCMRVSGKHNDLENVGPSLRHHTFFEMLGNFSFGDYFKADAIPYAWSLLTGVWKLPAERLHATVFAGEGGIPRDEEAYTVWRQFVPADRIMELGLDENFWSMGDTGPCGRCSEIHFFRGDHLPCPVPVCRGVSCSCDRFVEVWNNVFMEFDRRQDGRLTPLPAPSIDTGMGLERITSVLQDKLSNYDTDLFTPIIRRIEELTPARYGPLHPGAPSSAPDVSVRVVADHLRAMTFLIADGAVPSNEWRGYVLRKIMRRAMRHGKHLGVTQPFLHQLVGVIAREMGDAYPEVRSHREAIQHTILAEEQRFDAVLSEGLPKLEAEITAASKVLAGDKAFRLYDTFGLPLDFIEDIAASQGVAVDREGFEKAMETQRRQARTKSTFEAGRADEFVFTGEESRAQLESAGDRFEGYTTTLVQGVPVLALFDEHRRQVDELTEGQPGFLVLERTPFYLEAGGQVSDSGQIRSEATGAQATVEGLSRGGPSLPRVHRVRVTGGRFHVRDLVTAEVDRETRDATRRNHTATHLLHAALRQVLGSHVKQAGSLVAPDRLRFDFIHFGAVTDDEIQRIERIVNREIYRNAPVETEVRPTEDAIAAGAMALFGEKYGDRVRVVSIPDFSLELCGGTHCTATGDIGLFLIVQESGIAAGTRRIEAVTGAVAIEYVQRQRALVSGVLDALNVRGEQGVEAVQRLQADVKRLTREGSQLKMKLATGAGSADAGASHDEAIEVAGVRVVARRVEGLDRGALRDLADTLKSRLHAGIVVLGAATGGKASIVVAVSAELRGRAPAGQIVKQLAPIVGGGGGGRADFAEAGGKNPERLDEMLAQSRQVIERLLTTTAPSA